MYRMLSFQKRKLLWVVVLSSWWFCVSIRMRSLGLCEESCSLCVDVQLVGKLAFGPPCSIVLAADFQLLLLNYRILHHCWGLAFLSRPWELLVELGGWRVRSFCRVSRVCKNNVALPVIKTQPGERFSHEGIWILYLQLPFWSLCQVS